MTKVAPPFLWAAALLADAAAGGALRAQEGDRKVPFWPDAVPAAIHTQVDGGAALTTVRELSRFHRVQGSPGFAAAAEHVRGKLLAAGLADAAIERLPADGKTRYAHFRSYFGWAPVSAELAEVSPRPQPITSFPALPVALADYSQDADVTAELVDVGAGTTASDYPERSVAGRIVLADGALPEVHRLACEERGAAGFLSAFPNQKSAWWGDDRDLVRWGHLSPYQLRNRFAFMISRRQADELRARLAAGERIVLKAQVRAAMVPATYDVVVATIPGTDRAAEEVVLTAHLCHQSAGANDNASGSAAILEVARALQAGITRGTLPKPRRTLRFLWLPEIAGAQAYLIRHPELAKRLVAGVHMDMVGGLLATTRSTLHVSRSAESLPHAVNEIARAFLEEVEAASARYAERGGNSWRGFVWPPGSREPLLADLRPLELGSDHQVFQDSSFAVPMVYFHDWPDVYIHTSKDLPENLDATKLGRVAYMGAGIAWTLAALPDSEAPRLASLAAASARERIARAGVKGGAPEEFFAESEAFAVGIETLGSIARLWPGAAAAVREEESTLRRLPRRFQASPSRRDDRVPLRQPDVRGPLDVYYFDFFREVLGPAAPPPDPLLAKRENGEVLAFEALNLADGNRTISGIRDLLAGRYGSVPLSEVAAYFELLEKAKAIRLR